MTTATRHYLESIGRLGMILVPIGIAWGVLTAQVESKVDREVFVADSVLTHQQIDAILKLMDETNGELQETNQRLRELICVEQGAACR